MRPITANSLTTAEVRSPSGEELGKIVDLMIDTERGSVVYAVLASGGVLGVGAKMLAVPPRSLRLSGDRCVEIAIDTATLDAAEGFDRANPPQSADATLREKSASSRATARARGDHHG
jgi:hypothetical protein